MTLQVPDQDTLWTLYDCFFEEAPDRALFDEMIETAEELHFVAAIYNWDAGPELMLWALESPLCDLGTGMMIFWRTRPTYYQRYLPSEMPRSDAEGFQVVDAALQRAQRGDWSRQRISYDPGRDGMLDVSPDDAKWEIPENLLGPSPGAEFPDVYELLEDEN